MTAENILVIKHGALGDIILATGPMAAIRQHHPNAHITLLTTPSFKPLLQQSGWFNDVVADSRPKWWQVSAWLALIRFFRCGGFNRVYDLQTSRRSSGYKRFFPKGTEWSGIARGASHRHDTPHRTLLHTVDRQREQLAFAGIHDVPLPNIGWLTGHVHNFVLASPYALLVPGGSAHRPEKRWPAAHYSAICLWMIAHDITPVLIGTDAERDLLADIASRDPRIVNLCNRTDFGQIAELARHAQLAVGNDTGPMHIVAAAGCSSLVLFSAASNPALCAPRGAHVRVLQENFLAMLSPQSVEAALRQFTA